MKQPTDIDADVAIAGAGITGLTAALLLQERGLRVTILEQDSVASGESGNTTALLTVALDARYHYIKRKYSLEDARRVADASKASLEKITELVARHAIDCHFRRVPAYLYTEKRKYVSELKNEAAAAREAGIDAKWIADVPLPFETRGAVVFAEQAQFHPGEYLAAFAKIFTSKGGTLFERTLITAMKDGVVETESVRVRARDVFLTTNVPVAGFTPHRTYAIAFEESGEHPDGLFRDTADPYHYTCWQETNEGTFLIVGGEAGFDDLLAYAREHFGERRERNRWSEQIIEPRGGLPLIGGKDHVYMSTGYAGQGMTFGTLGAMIVADAISGIDNPWKDLFDESRKRPEMTPREFLNENLQFPALSIEDRIEYR